MRSEKEKRNREKRHSFPFFHESKAVIEHDSFFNNKRKSLYESELAALCLKYTALFMPVITKVSTVILTDICRVSIEKDCDEISRKMHDFLLNDYDIRTIFDSSNISDFYTDIISSLKAQDSASFYKHMCLQFAYIIFFTTGNREKPELYQAINEDWCSHLNLSRFISDMNRYRNDELLFQNYQRLKRNYTKEKETKNIGILPEESYHDLPKEKQKILSNILPNHQAGKLLFFMTSSCNSTASGMHFFDLPQLCGPSGTTAKRLALANQAGLEDDEMALFHFFVAMFNLAIGAHTIDESFIIAQDENFNHYIRGDYRTIIPEIVKKDSSFLDFYKKIENINQEYSDILIHSSLVVATEVQSFNAEDHSCPY